MRLTHNQAKTYEHSLNHSLEFFAKAGSLFERRQSYYASYNHQPYFDNLDYGSETSALSLFINSWIVDKEISLQLLFWLRDCRGGAGNRSATRRILNWLADNDNEGWLKSNLELIPKYGRWDDLVSLYDTPLELAALELWANVIASSGDPRHALACKWASRRDNKLRKHMGATPRQFRQTLAQGTRVVETQMCNREWYQIEYEHVPSIAMARYARAFNCHDDERFNAYKNNVKTGKSKINTNALFPHDCLRTAVNGDLELADLAFANLPDYVTDKTQRIIVMADSSGSMDINISGSVKAGDIAKSLALYFSARLETDNPFYKKFLQFSNDAELTDWQDMQFSKVVTASVVFNGYAGSTNLQKALQHLLEFARFFKVEKVDMPSIILIISDMQFNEGITAGTSTEVEYVISQWEKYGYTTPKIIYWNTAGYAGSPTLAGNLETGLVSGFSPAVLNSVLEAKTITPEMIMVETLAKYIIRRPN